MASGLSSRGGIFLRTTVFLRLAEYFAAEDDGGVGRHLHREAIVAHVLLVRLQVHQFSEGPVSRNLRA